MVSWPFRLGQDWRREVPQEVFQAAELGLELLGTSHGFNDAFFEHEKWEKPWDKALKMGKTHGKNLWI